MKKGELKYNQALLASLALGLIDNCYQASVLAIHYVNVDFLESDKYFDTYMVFKNNTKQFSLN